jgi:DNA modification methylase
MSVKTLSSIAAADWQLEKLRRMAAPNTAVATPLNKTSKPVKHLTYKDKTNLGSFYTPNHLVVKVYELVNNHNILSDIDVILEPSCGYGAFFNVQTQNEIRFIGADIDKESLNVAQQEHPEVEFLCVNALHNVSRKNYGIKDNEKILIVGNPPYNDKTSHIKNDVKEETSYPVDTDLQTRDIGLSSLLAYAKLQPEYIAVLHPLSYLIKKTNFGILRRLTSKYKLLDALVFSSQEFPDTSRDTGFPLLIALYQKDRNGMEYAALENYRFPTLEGNYFSLKQFDYIDNYISKYPGKFKQPNFNGYLFYTLRDINALKRSRTFIKEDIPNAIQIQPDKLPYYHYVDVFKDTIETLPYYMGNMSIPIANKMFLAIQEEFVLLSKIKHPALFPVEKVSKERIAAAKQKVDFYFRQLFNR